jgi:hypothetical protein
MEHFKSEPRRKPVLLERLRERIRLKHYSIRTEQAYVEWIRRYLGFYGWCYPTRLGATEVEGFLTHLAVKGRVSASTQNQAIVPCFSYIERYLALNCRGWTGSRERRPRAACQWC